MKVLFKHWLIKNESTFDVDALMTFTIITRPFFDFDIQIYIYIFQFSGVNVRALNEGWQFSWKTLHLQDYFSNIQFYNLRR